MYIYIYMYVQKTQARLDTPTLYTINILIKPFYTLII